MDIEERVARVIHRTTANVRGSWDKLHPGTQNKYTAQAQAVLAEIESAAADAKKARKNAKAA